MNKEINFLTLEKLAYDFKEWIQFFYPEEKMEHYGEVFKMAKRIMKKQQKMIMIRTAIASLLAGLLIGQIAFNLLVR
jgi:hypothetical protein